MEIKTARTADVNPRNTAEMHIRLRAENVQATSERNVFEIVLLAKPLSPEESKWLDALFPHCYSDIELLLAREALLNSLVR